MKREPLLYAFTKAQKEIYDIVEKHTRGYCIDKIKVNYSDKTKTKYGIDIWAKGESKIKVLEIFVFTKGDKIVQFYFTDNGIFDEKRISITRKSFEAISKYVEEYHFDIIAPSEKSREEHLSCLRVFNNYLLNNAYWAINKDIPKDVHITSCEINKNYGYNSAQFNIEVTVSFEKDTADNRGYCKKYRIGTSYFHNTEHDAITLKHQFDNIYEITIPPEVYLSPKMSISNSLHDL